MERSGALLSGETSEKEDFSEGDEGTFLRGLTFQILPFERQEEGGRENL